MAMGTRKKRERQEDLWVVTSEVVGAPAHAFYDRLNEILGQHHFDRNVEHLCRRYYKGGLGRPSITPGVYFRALLLGYFEGIDSERGIAWRLADSLSMGRFIAYALTEETPDQLHHLADTAVVCSGNPQSSIPMGAEDPGRGRAGGGENGFDRCHNAGSQRGTAITGA